jgi:hypothetical protein
MPENKLSITVENGDAGLRLDALISLKLGGYNKNPRSASYRRGRRICHRNLEAYAKEKL